MIVICTGPLGDPQSEQNWMLASTLAAAGRRVTLIVSSARREPIGRWQGCEVLQWPSGIPGKWRDGIFFWKLLENLRPQAVLANFQSINIAMPVALLRGVPHRVAWHRSLAGQTPMDFPRRPGEQRAIDLMKGAVLRCATRIVPISLAARRDVIAAYGVRPEKCEFLIHTCRPDPMRFLAGKSIGKSPRRTIAYMGRITPSKGVDVLLHALRLLHDREPDWTLELELIGRDAMDGRLERLAAELGISDRVRFVGFLPQGEAFARVAAAHVLAFPIRVDPGPGVIPEGLGLGVPIVATAAGGIGELLAGTDAVSLVPPDDPRALANALHAVLSDPELGARMSRNGRALFEQKFHMDHWVSAVRAWLENEIAMAPARQGARP